MGIVAEDVERARSAVNLVDLVSEKVALRRVGTRWVGLCPFHNENTASFSVNGELGRYYCFGCQTRGDAISWLRETEHLDFPTAVEALAARAGITLRYDSAERGGAAHKRSQELAEVMEGAVAWYHERLLHALSPDAKRARAYLRSERGYDGDTVKHFRLGWAPAGWDTLVRELGAPVDLLVETGLAFRNQGGRPTDSFRERVLFPIFDPAGRAVGFGGRVLPGGPGPKYKNTQATPLYDKSRVLYGLNWAKGPIVERGRVVVCEGYTDVIGLHLAGIREAVATCGTALAEGHVKLLVGFSRRIVLAYDADTAGQGAAEHFYDWERHFDADISVVALPAGADPADVAKREPESLHKAVVDATPYLGFRLRRMFAAADLRNPEGRAKAAETALAMVAEHPDPLVRDQYLMQVADRTRLSPSQLRALTPPAAAGPAQPGRTRNRPGERVPSKPRPATVPPPELEALRLAVHHPEKVAGRLDAALFGSGTARAAYEELASALTLHDAIEASGPEVADLLGQLAMDDTAEDPDDVLRRVLDRAAMRSLAEIRRHAQATGDLELAQQAQGLQLALHALRAVEAGPGYENSLATAEASLLALLLGAPKVSPGEAR
ncbi:MAG TPA: DNA primase [Acidimicrobiales bacterium]|nr:DNA primase [Acidimicrobiales bacterium]